MNAHPEMLVDKPPKAYRWWRFIERSLPVIVIYLMVMMLIGFLIAPNVIVTVPTGHVGILWKRFRGGTQLDPRALKDEGMRILLPWDKIFLYDLRLQTTSDTYNAISKDGVNLATTINIRFRLKHDAVPKLHQSIGPDYISRLLRPEIGNRAREIIAEYTAEEVYSSKRQEIQKRIRTHTETMLGQSMIQRTEQESEYGEHYRVTLDEMLILFDTLVLGLELPKSVVAAINRKVEQYYMVQEYAFRVEREKKESERKQIEANGIRDFQQTVTQGISDSYVRWRGIEATLQLAQSQNAKIVIIGSGKDGLPVILGNVDSPVQPQGNVSGNAQNQQDSGSGAEAGTNRLSGPPLESPHDGGQPSPQHATQPSAPAGRPPTTPIPAAPRASADEKHPGVASRPAGTISISEIQDIIARVLRGNEAKLPPQSHPQPATLPPEPPLPPHRAEPSAGPPR